MSRRCHKGTIIMIANLALYEALAKQSLSGNCTEWKEVFPTKYTISQQLPKLALISKLKKSVQMGIK